MPKNEKVIPIVGLQAAKKAAKAKKANTINTMMEKTMTTTTKPNFEKLASEANATSKEHVDAFVKSGTLLAKGTEDLLKTYVGLAQASAEKSTEAVKALMACKTLNEFTETQTKLAQDSFENYISGVTKLSELTVKLASSTFEPINTQLSKTMKKATDAVAA